MKRPIKSEIAIVKILINTLIFALIFCIPHIINDDPAPADIYLIKINNDSTKKTSSFNLTGKVNSALDTISDNVKCIKNNKPPNSMKGIIMILITSFFSFLFFALGMIIAPIAPARDIKAR